MFKAPEKIPVGHYLVDKKKFLGKGQYGCVYGCEDQQNPDLSLCAKVMQSNEVEKILLKREIDILKLLMPLQKDNQNLIQVYDILEEKNSLYIIMEICGDGDLKQLMDKRKKNKTWFTVEEATNIARQIAKGYKTLYQHKIIHRDIKPANILISKDVFKIADLGMGRIIEDMNYASNFTKVGTPAYAAPQLFLESKFSSKADVYSLGVIYFQLVYGILPIEAKTQPELIEKLRGLQVNPIQCEEKSSSGPVPLNVRKLIQNMLLYDEKDRFSWMDVFSSDVLKLDIVHYKQTSTQQRKLTLTNLNSIKYQDFYRVQEISESKILQLIRILTTKSDLANKCHKLLQEQKSCNRPLSFTSGQLVLLSVSLSGYRYKVIQNILGLLLNQYHQLIPEIQKIVTEQELQAYFGQPDENKKVLKEYIQKCLNSAILMFREDECRFFNQGQNVSDVNVKEMKKILELDEDTNYVFFAQQFTQFFSTFKQSLKENLQESTNQDLLVNLNKMEYIEKFYTLDISMHTKPSDILEKTQLIS